MIDDVPADLLEDLNKMSTWFFEQDRSKFELKPSKITWQEGTSIEYLHKQQAKSEISGFPEAACGLDFNIVMEGYDLDTFRPKLIKADTALRSYLSGRSCALKMYYPAGGFIDWHTNANAYGFNVLLTYSLTGEGAFMYQHPLTKEIITLEDKPGWTMKVGMYDKPGGAPLWHCAYTQCERLNWGYILDERGWANLVEELNIDLAEMESIYGPLPSFI